MSKKQKSGTARSRGLGISSRGAVRLAHAQKSTGVKPCTYATLVFPVAFTSSSVSGGTWYWQWRINSLYDPDFTGGGAQPTTFDQWMALYDRYRVLACDVDLTVTETANSQVLALSGAPSQDAVPTLSFAGIAGMRDAKLGVRGSYTNESRVHRTFLIKDVFGVDEEAMMSEVNYSGTSGSSAPSVAYFSLGAFLSSGSTGSVQVAGTLRFAVRFESPHANNVSVARTPSIMPLEISRVRAEESALRLHSDGCPQFSGVASCIQDQSMTSLSTAIDSPREDYPERSQRPSKSPGASAPVPIPKQPLRR